MTCPKCRSTPPPETAESTRLQRQGRSIAGRPLVTHHAGYRPVGTREQSALRLPPRSCRTIRTQGTRANELCHIAL